jgi:hypothetical protein
MRDLMRDGLSRGMREGRREWRGRRARGIGWRIILSVNANTIDFGQEGLDLKEWTEKGWAIYKSRGAHGSWSGAET